MVNLPYDAECVSVPQGFVAAYESSTNYAAKYMNFDQWSDHANSCVFALLFIRRIKIFSVFGVQSPQNHNQDGSQNMYGNL